MKSQVQAALLIAALLYFSWAMGLFLMPEASLKLITTGPENTTLTAMFAAALLGFATMFLVTAHEPGHEAVQGAAIGLGFIGATAGYQMLIVKTMPQTTPTVISLILSLGLAIYLFMLTSENASRIGQVGAGRRGSAKAKPKARRRR
jgi:hypothetical protein